MLQLLGIGLVALCGLTADDPLFFNGKDTTGWKGLDHHWKVEEGAIIGTTMPKGINFNTFLCSSRKFKNFELAFEVKLEGGKGNSGVQIRSEVVDPVKLVVKGPQCDIGDVYWGSLFGERFGGMMQAAPKESVTKVVKKAEFNSYSIRCADKHVTIKVNGETMVDGDFPKMPDEGIIAWQLHGGVPMTVAFRKISFKELP